MLPEEFQLPYEEICPFAISDGCGYNGSMQTIDRLFSFIGKSPSPYHAVDTAAGILAGKGFTELREGTPFAIRRGGRYYIKRAGTALIAFIVPSDPRSFSIIAAHTDSPCFKVKTDPEHSAGGLYTVLDTEGYGGMLMSPWFDRPLSIAGRIAYREGNAIRTALYDAGRPLVLIPSLAIHMDRKANEGVALSIQKDMMPLFSEGTGKGSLMRLIEKETGITGILGDDLYVYSASEPAIWGADGEFFSAPRIDDLMCAWGAVSALSEAAEPSSIAMAALFSSEETGSGSVSGALSDFLPSVMSRLMDSLGMDSEDKAIAISSSFMLSADNGHAVHPAHLDKADPESHPVLNGGVLLKYSAQNKYMTDGETGAYVKMLCQDSGIPFQIFHNHSDIPGGSTLGNLAVEKVSVRGADIGVAQLAMHSPYETAGVRDADHLLRFFSAFYAARR